MRLLRPKLELDSSNVECYIGCDVLEKAVMRTRTLRQLRLCAIVLLFSAILLPRWMNAQVYHPDGTPLPSFEVATIKPLDGAPPPMPGGPPQTAFDEIRLFVNTRILISMAYDVQGFARTEIVGGPGWLDDQLYEVHAKINEPLSEEMQRMPDRERRKKIELMEQSLLAERFKLRVHFETRELPAYEIVVAKGGPKLTLAGPLMPHNGNRRISTGQSQKLRALGITVENLAQMLQWEPEAGGRIVVDRTRLTGSYDISLDWTRDPALTRGSASEASPSQNIGPSLFTALEEELGLKLVATKAPVEVIVIDHIERPTEN